MIQVVARIKIKTTPGTPLIDLISELQKIQDKFPDMTISNTLFTMELNTNELE